ncbi:hypothetical protein [Vibrio scophthalmi]|nr:hypothetical protein [Vibrio scophthalmi]
MSYKNISNHGAVIALTQESIDTELNVTVKRYCTHSDDSGIIEINTTTMDEFDSCAQTYREYLAEVIN